MKLHNAVIRSISPAFLTFLAGTTLAQPLTTALTYQGDLAELGVPAEGLHDMQFRLYTLAAGGLQVGATQCANNVSVSNGKFTVIVDFGAQFAGQQRFLEIDVRTDSGLSCANPSGYTTLTGRQPLTASPYAAYSLNAGAATTATNATTAANSTNLNGQPPAFYLNLANHTGTLPGPALSGSYTNAITFGNVSGTFSGNGAGLSALNASSIASGTVDDLRLSPNIARLNAVQTFSAVQTFTARPSFTSAGSPFSVGNSNLVTLLNADYLDGYDSSAFGRLSINQTWTGVNTFQSTGGLNLQNGAGQPITQLTTAPTASRLLQLPDVNGIIISTGNLSAITAVANNAIISASIADNTVTSSDIQDGTIVGADIANNSITAAKLASDIASLNKVTAGKMDAVAAGVGVGTATPEAPLHILKGTAGSVTADGNSVLVLENSTRSYLSILSPGDERAVFFGSPANATDGGVVYNNASTPNGLQFRTNGNTSRMALTSAGKLGLGTLAPSAPFHLMSDDQLIGQFDGNNAAGVWLELKNRAPSGRTWSLITTGTANSEGAGKFLVRDGTSAAVRMAIDTSGFVGIGTTSPTRPLEVRAGTTSFTVNPGSLFGAADAAAVTLDTPGTGTIGVWDNFSVNNNLAVGGTSAFNSSAAFNNAGAPFTVASSTKVTGLNADLLDGFDSGQFLLASPTVFSVSGTNAGIGSITGTNASSTASSAGVRGIASFPLTATTYGVYGSSASSLGTGVYGTVTSGTTNVVHGVKGFVTQQNGVGVMGHSTGSAGYGVQGRSDSASDSSFAVYGTATSGAKGVVGDSASNDGVWGASGSGVGVRATTDTGSIALYGERTANGNKGWFGGFGEGGWAESATGNGMVCLSGSAAAAAVYCRNDGGGLAINADGEVKVRVLTIVGGSDLAEPFDVADSPVRDHHAATAPVPGMVVCIDPENPGKLILSSEAYDAKVAGIISGANGLSPGMVMKAEGVEHAHGEHAVAMTGRVWCFVDASREAIRPGDRLTTSPTPGHAMKAADPTRADGAVIGKAMTPLAAGEKGLVLVLVNLQ
ncbi:MAG: hypothetical protein JNK25_10070 [Phycisphaerae bacterium]|nr:hypothetical protein [Phycisphaerae bacterium]